MSPRFELAWAASTGLLCLLVMLALAFTGLLALAGGLLVIALSAAVRRLLVWRRSSALNGRRPPA